MLTLGINYPWVTCGHDFGPRPPAWQNGKPQRRDFGDVERDLSGLRALGISVVRFWVLAGGVNYPVGESADAHAMRVTTSVSPATAAYDALRWALGERDGDLPDLSQNAHTFTVGRRYEVLGRRVGEPHVVPPPLPELFLHDFQGLLTACRNSGTRLLPSLLSFEFFQPLVDVDGRVHKRGREAFVFGATMEELQARALTRDIAPEVELAMKRFTDATLSPLLAASRGYDDALYAFELINEPEWAVRPGPLQFDTHHFGRVPTTHRVSAELMSRFLQHGTSVIAASGFRASVGFGEARPTWLSPTCHAHLRTLSRTGQYVHQRHHYPTLFGAHTLPRAEEAAFTPCVLGEFPTAMSNGLSNTRWQDAPLRRSERDPQTYLRARLEHIAHQGYDLALLWSAHSQDERRAFDTGQRAQVRSFYASMT